MRAIFDSKSWHIYSFFTTRLVVLQRKNGLFKKAYELGVLCSVDVAVILFGLNFIPSSYLLQLTLVLFLSPLEQRPGHPSKLYQYGSSDIREIIQRQLRVRLIYLSFHVSP